VSDSNDLADISSPDAFEKMLFGAADRYITSDFQWFAQGNCYVCGLWMNMEGCPGDQKPSLIGYVHWFKDATSFRSELRKIDADPLDCRMLCMKFLCEIDEHAEALSAALHRDFNDFISPSPIVLLHREKVVVAWAVDHGCHPEGAAGIFLWFTKEWIPSTCAEMEQDSFAHRHCLSCKSAYELSRLPGTTNAPRSCVYFMQQASGGPIKIGFTTNLAARVASIQTATPGAIRVLATIPGGSSLEGFLHWRFERDKIRGEWFAPSPELLQLIAEVRGKP
jgi:hypothetical protein